MIEKKLESLLEQIKVLSPSEKGQLFNLFLLHEKTNMKCNRQELFGSVKVVKELTDEDIKSSQYNPNLDDLLN